MSEIILTAVITAASGKDDRVEELLKGMTKYVHENEPDTLRYNLLKGEASSYVVLETYKNKEALETHRSSEPYKNLFAAVEKESLLAGAPTLFVGQPIAGFESRNDSLKQ